jgi:hypothetical protein
MDDDDDDDDDEDSALSDDCGADDDCVADELVPADTVETASAEEDDERRDLAGLALIDAASMARGESGALLSIDPPNSRAEEDEEEDDDNAELSAPELAFKQAPEPTSD